MQLLVKEKLKFSVMEFMAWGPAQVFQGYVGDVIWAAAFEFLRVERVVLISSGEMGEGVNRCYQPFVYGG